MDEIESLLMGGVLAGILIFGFEWLNGVDSIDLGALSLTSVNDAINNFLSSDNTNNGGLDMFGNKFTSLFHTAGSATGVPPTLLSSVAFQESSFNPDAVNKTSGASGLMQLMPQFYPGVDPFNPNQAVPAAAGSLAEYYREFGNWFDALAAYNWGPGYVRTIRSGGVVHQNGHAYTSIPGPVQNYANSILSRAGLA